MLDMAEEAIKPLSVTLKKGEIIRAIEKDSEKNKKEKNIDER